MGFDRRQLLLRMLGLVVTVPDIRTIVAVKPSPTFDVKRYGARGDGLTDDTAAVQRAVDAATASASGGASVYFPTGTYRLVKRIDAIFAVGCHGDGITFRGDGDGSRIVTDTAEGAAFFVSGAGKPEGDTNWWPNVYHNLPQRPILPAQRGDATVDLANANDAAHFSPGDYVYVRTGQILDVYPGYTEPDSEINQVTSVSGATLHLRWRLVKDYAQEYYVDGTTGRTSRTPSPNPAPLAVSNVNAVTMKDVTFRDLAFDVTGDSGAIAGGQIVGLQLTNLTGTFRSVFQSMGDYRTATLEQLQLTGRGNGVEAVYVPVTTAKGTTDVTIRRSTLSAEGLCMIHLHEGSAQVTFERNTVLSAVNSTGNHVVSMRGRAYGMTISRNEIRNGAVNGFAVIADVTCDGGGTIADNTIRGQFVNVIEVDAPNWDVHDNTILL